MTAALPPILVSHPSEEYGRSTASDARPSDGDRPSGNSLNGIEVALPENLDGSSQPLPPLPRAIAKKLITLEPVWDNLCDSWKQRVVDSIEKTDQRPEMNEKDERYLTALANKLESFKLRKAAAVAEQSQLTKRVDELHIKRERVLNLISEKTKIGHEIGGDQARTVLLQSRVERIEAAEADAERATKNLDEIQTKFAELKKRYDEVKGRYRDATSGWEEQSKKALREANVAATGIARRWFEVVRKRALELGNDALVKIADSLAEQNNRSRGKTWLDLRRIRENIVLSLFELEQCCVDDGDVVETKATAGRKAMFVATDIELDFSSCSASIGSLSAAGDTPSRQVLSRLTQMGKRTTLFGNQGHFAFPDERRHRSHALDSHDYTEPVKLNETFTTILDKSNDAVIEKLLHRPRCSLENWKGENTRFESFWRGCWKEENFEKAMVLTGFYLDHEQYMLLAYEEAILISIHKPEFGDLICHLRLPFNIPMSVHHSLLASLVPDGAVGMNPLDIRYRCVTLLNPSVLVDVDFVRRQLWVLKQSVFPKEEKFALPALGLIGELERRCGVDGGLLEPTASIKDPLCEAGDLPFWEDLFEETSSAYLAASLLRILDQIAGDTLWLPDQNMQMVFCGPLWSGIVDCTYDNFLNPDATVYAELIGSHFDFPTEIMSVMAASRLWYHIHKSLEDGDTSILHEDALASLERLTLSFDTMFPHSSLAAEKSHVSPRDVVTRRIITSEFRDQLIWVLKDYRKYCMNGLDRLIKVLIAVFKFVNYDENGPEANGSSTDENTLFVQVLLRWCAFSAGQQQASRLMPAFVDSTTNILEEQQELQKFILGIANCIKNMRMEIPIEESMFSAAWESAAEFFQHEHIAIIVAAMRIEIMKHLSFLVSQDGPWTKEEEIAPGIGHVLNEVIQFEDFTAPLLQKGGGDALCASHVPTTLVYVVDRKIDDALRVRWNILDEEMIRVAIGVNSAWDPVRTADNILHSQSVVDLWHFVYEALDAVEGFLIPPKVYGRTFLNFMFKLTDRFMKEATRGMQHKNEKGDKIFPLAEKGFMLYKNLPMPVEDGVKEREKKEKYYSSLFRTRTADKGPLHLLQQHKTKYAPSLNECIVRLRSVAFYLQQLDGLLGRFEGSDSEKTWCSFVEDTGIQCSISAKQICRLFPTVLIYTGCEYMFKRMYSADEDFMTMADLLLQEKQEISSLLTLVRVPESMERNSTGKAEMRDISDDRCVLEPQEYAEFCAYETAHRFYQAWIVIVLARLRDEVHLDPDMIERDIDAIKGFAMDITGTYFETSDSVLAISAVFAQSWSGIRMKGWADEMLKLDGKQVKNKRRGSSGSPEIANHRQLDLEVYDSAGAMGTKSPKKKHQFMGRFR